MNEELSIGDVWGAKSKRTHVEFMSLKDSMLLIHHKIVAMHDHFDNDMVQVDNKALQQTTGLQDYAWDAVINLNVEYIADRQPVSELRIKQVAAVLLGLTCDDWMDLAASQTELLPEGIY